MKPIKIFTDGGARGNPGPAAAGAVVEGLAGNLRLICGKYLGVATNNVAEYSAVLLVYETILAKEKVTKTLELNFFTDSLLVAKQLSGDYRIKNPNLARFTEKIKQMEKLFYKVDYQHVPRAENKLADQEVNRILDQHVR